MQAMKSWQFLTPLPMPIPHTQAMQSQMLTGGAKLEDVPASSPHRSSSPLPPPPLLHAQAMQSQMLTGGAKLEDVPAFRAILAREHRRIRGEEGSRWGRGGGGGEGGGVRPPPHPG